VQKQNLYIQFMKTVRLITTTLFVLFFVPAIAVHFIGLFKHITDESTASHLIHVFSYSLCLYTILFAVKHRLSLYAIGAVYPFLFHANCFLTPLLQQNKISPICLLVIVMLPLGALWIRKGMHHAV
jgi:hypothetical protein